MGSHYGDLGIIKLQYLFDQKSIAFFSCFFLFPFLVIKTLAGSGSEFNEFGDLQNWLLVFTTQIIYQNQLNYVLYLGHFWYPQRPIVLQSC
jgi:hypothetical protein